MKTAVEWYCNECLTKAYKTSHRQKNIIISSSHVHRMQSLTITHHIPIHFAQNVNEKNSLCYQLYLVMSIMSFRTM